MNGKRFVQGNRATYDILKHKIRATAPDFRAFPDHEGYVKHDLGLENERDLDCEVFAKSRGFMGLQYGPHNLTDVRRVIRRFVYNLLRTISS